MWDTAERSVTRIDLHAPEQQLGIRTCALWAQRAHLLAALADVEEAVHIQRAHLALLSQRTAYQLWDGATVSQHVEMEQSLGNAMQPLKLHCSRWGTCREYPTFLAHACMSETSVEG